MLLTANSLVTGLGGLLFWMLAARIYEQAVVGAATAGTALAVFLAGVSQLGLGLALVRYGRELGPRRRQRLTWLFLIVCLAAALVGSLCVVAGPAVAPGLAAVVGSRAEGALFVASCIGWTLSVQYDNYLMSRDLAALLVAKSLITGLLRPGLALAWPQATPALVVALTGLAGALGVLLVAVPAARVRPAPHDGPAVTMGRVAGFAGWNYLGGLAGTMPALLIPTLVLSRLGPAPAAAASLAWTLFGPALFAPAALGLALLGGGARGAAQDAPRGWLAAPLLWGVPAAVLPLAGSVLWLLGPGYLRDGGPVLLALLGGYWAYCWVQLLTARLRLAGPQWRLSLPTVVCNLAIVAGSLPLLELVGPAGGAMAWTGGQWLLALALWAGLRLAPAGKAP